MEKKWNIYLLDEHPVTREGLRAFLNEEHRFHIGGEGGGIKKARKDLQTGQIDLLLMELLLPYEDGFALMSELKGIFPELKIVVITFFRDWSYLRRADEIGIEGYLLKDEPGEMIIRALIEVMNGGRVFPPEMAPIISHEQESDTIRKRLNLLSRREREILDYISRGYTNKEIATALGLSIRTVESHRAHIMNKLKIKTTMELARFAMHPGTTSHPTPA